MKTKPLSFTLLLLWHGLFAGSYTIAYLTSEEGRALHQFAGYFLSALLALRLAIAAVVSEKSAWALPWAGAKLWETFWRKIGGRDRSALTQRTPLAPLSGLVILATLILVFLTGLTAAWWKWEDLHEGIAEGSLLLVLAHIALVSIAPLAKRMHHKPLQARADLTRENVNG